MRQKYRKKRTNSTETEQNPIPQFCLPFESGVSVPELGVETQCVVPEQRRKSSGRQRRESNDLDSPKQSRGVPSKKERRKRRSGASNSEEEAVYCGVETADDDYWEVLLGWVESNVEKEVDRKPPAGCEEMQTVEGELEDGNKL